MTSYSTKIYNISSWIDDQISNIPLKVQIQRYRCLKLDILGFMFRQSAHEEWILPSHYVGAHTVNKLYKIPSWTDAPLSNIPIKVQIQRYRCLKLNILSFIYRQSAHEEWVLPSHYVGAHTVKNYIKIQVGLTLQLAIFPLKSKYKDTDVWNLTYWILCFGNQLLKNEFCQVLMFDLIVSENILYLKLDWRSN